MPAYIQQVPPDLGIHRGAIDQTTVTSQPPPEVMKRVKEVLDKMGIQIEVESEYRYRCIRAKRHENGVDLAAKPEPVVINQIEAENRSRAVDEDPDPEVTPKAAAVALPQERDIDVQASAPPQISKIIYGQRSEEPGDEVRFSVELTRLDRLVNTYSLDVRRLRGNLRSYKFIYDQIRQSVDLQH